MFFLCLYIKIKVVNGKCKVQMYFVLDEYYIIIYNEIFQE